MALVTVMIVAKTSHNALVWCVLYTFPAPILYAFLLRLAMIGLTYSQPFLITRLIDYVSERNPNKDEGYGMIGAFALVFVMKGVFLFPFHSLIKNLRSDISLPRSSIAATSTLLSASSPRFGERSSH